MDDVATGTGEATPRAVVDVRADDLGAMGALSALCAVGPVLAASGRGVDLAGFRVVGVDRLVVAALEVPSDLDAWGHASATRVDVLETSVGGALLGRDLFDAVWAARVLSLDATCSSGRNPDVDVGDRSCVALAEAMVARLGAVVDPCRCVAAGRDMDPFGWEYDAVGRTLTVSVHAS